MNIMMVDVTDIPDLRRGEQVTLIGRDHNASITVEELARLADSINYELLARLGPHIPRFRVKGFSDAGSGQPG